MGLMFNLHIVSSLWQPVIVEPDLVVGLCPGRPLHLHDVLPELPLEGLEYGGREAGQVGDAPQCVQQGATTQLFNLKKTTISIEFVKLPR